MIHGAGQPGRRASSRQAKCMELPTEPDILDPMNIQRQIADPSAYERDFHAWTQKQAEALAHGDTAALDLENLTEEVRSLGVSERRELRNRIVTVLEHLLKYHYGLNRDPADGWFDTIQRERTAVLLLLADSPSLRRLLDDLVSDSYPYARDRALASSRRFEAGRADHYGATLPETSRYTAEQVLDLEFLPEG